MRASHMGNKLKQYAFVCRLTCIMRASCNLLMQGELQLLSLLLFPNATQRCLSKAGSQIVPNVVETQKNKFLPEPRPDMAVEDNEGRGWGRTIDSRERAGVLRQPALHGPWRPISIRTSAFAQSAAIFLASIVWGHVDIQTDLSGS